jgi:hypothetical protein
MPAQLSSTLLTHREQNTNIALVQTDARERGWNKAIPFGFAASTRDTDMIAALATAAFLATLWLLAMIGLGMLEDSGEKIVAALKGRSPLAMKPQVEAGSWKISPRNRARPVMRVRPTLRAAA